MIGMIQKSNKEIYRELCSKEESIPIYSKDWYLDAVCGKDNWDVALVVKSGEVFASLPYFIEKKLGFTILQMPKLTQVLGPWIKYPPGQKYETKLKHEEKIISELISLLPKFHYFKQKFHHQYQNWLPFYWHGFTQTSNYTYVIEDTSNLYKVFDEFNGSTKRQVKKAEKILRVSESNDLEKFYEINKKSFEKNSMKIPYSFSFVKRLDEALHNHAARKILLATDEDNNLHAAIYLVYDSNSVYYLMGGIDNAFSSSGAQSLLMWKGIQLASQLGNTFDFEGSMIKQVERFFRSFGAQQKNIFRISKTNSFLIKLALTFSDK